MHGDFSTGFTNALGSKIDMQAPVINYIYLFSLGLYDKIFFQPFAVISIGDCYLRQGLTMALCMVAIWPSIDSACIHQQYQVIFMQTAVLWWTKQVSAIVKCSSKQAIVCVQLVGKFLVQACRQLWTSL